MSEWLSQRTKALWVLIVGVADAGLAFADDNVITFAEWTEIVAVAITLVGVYLLPNKVEGINVQTRAKKQVEMVNSKVARIVKESGGDIGA